MQISADEILYYEYLDQIRDYIFTLPRIEKEQEIETFLEGIHPCQQEKEKKYLQVVNDRISAKDQQWNQISIANSKATLIDVSIINSETNEEISSKIPLEIQLPTTGCVLKIVGNKIFISSNGGKINENYPIKTYNNIKKELPSIYNILIYAVFIGHLARPQTINIEKPFKIQIASKVQIEKNNNNKELDYIEISKNHLPDFRIILPSLAYIDTFATCDIHLVALIKYLFPQYENKLKLF